MRGSSGHVHPRATLRSQLASRASLLVPHRSSKALRSCMCYRMPSGYSSRVGYISFPVISILRGLNFICMTDGTERQIIKDMEGNNQRPKIKYCSICDPFVFILREDDTIGLFIGEPERGKIRRKDMSPMGEKVRRYLHTSFPYTNRSTEDITIYCWLILQRHNWHLQNSRKRKCPCFEW